MIFYYSFQVHEQVEERGEVCFEESKVCLFFIGEGEKKRCKYGAVFGRKICKFHFHLKKGSKYC